MTTAPQRTRRAVAYVTVVLAALLLAACTQSGAPASAATTTTHRHTATTNTKSLSAPKTSFAQDTKFFTDVTEADPALVTYEKDHGNVALQALLTDGSAFCALLKRGGGIDKALVAEAEGARSAESRTSLPLSVTTFNTIESVALLTLCPSDLRLVPASVRTRIRNLGEALGNREVMMNATGHATVRGTVTHGSGLITQE